MREIETPHGTARVHEQEAARGWATLVLGHGAGGSVSARDLQTAARTALDHDVGVALVEQPYRVAERRSTPRPPVLDAAWLAVTETLSGPLIFGGRSSGARVACRTAAAGGAIGVLALAFPLVTPKGVSRQDELDAVAVPLLVVQGASDRFGMPAGAVQVEGDHGLKTDHALIGATIADWLETLRP